MKDYANVKNLWIQLQQIDHRCADYFPDSFLKKTPPREFFFQILYARYRPLYKEVFEKVKEKLVVEEPFVPEPMTKPEWLTDMMNDYSHVDNPLEMSCFISEEAR